MHYWTVKILEPTSQDFSDFPTSPEPKKLEQIDEEFFPKQRAEVRSVDAGSGLLQRPAV